MTHVRSWVGLVMLPLFTLFWCGKSGVATVAVLREDDAPVVAMVLMGMFDLAGLGLIAATMHGVLARVGIRPTIVELSEHPVRLGQPFELVVAQAGPLRMDSWVGKLVCEESATYGVGTNSRTDTHVVYERELFTEGSVRVPRGHPYQYRGEQLLPVRGMCSFASEHNRVRWFVRVVGDIPNFPDLEHDIEIAVIPAGTKGEPWTAG